VAESSGSEFKELTGETMTPEANIPTISGDEDFAKLGPGSKYIGPDKKTRVKPYEIADDTDFASVPEGAEYMGPDKKVRIKPTYEGIGFTAEMLHDMAVTPDAKKQALEKFYPGKVKEDVAGLYIDDDGKLRRPGAQRGLSELAGYTASEAAPLGGMTAGGVVGTGLGPAGIAGGGVLGAMGGRSFNNAVLALFGIHQNLSENVSSTLWEGAYTAVGEGVGKVASKALSGASKIVGKTRGLKDKAKNVSEGLHEILESFGITPERARYFLGTTQETIERARNLTEKHGPGVVPPSILAPEAPMLTKLEEFDQIFQGRNVFGERARDVYEADAKELLEHPEIGVKLDESLTAATKSVSSKRAGELALNVFQEKLARDDAALEAARKAALEDVRAPVREAGGEQAFADQQKANRERLVQAQAQTAQTAKDFVQAGINDIKNDVESAAMQAEQGGRAGTLWRMVGRKFRSWNVATRQRASGLYDVSDVAGGATPITGAGETLGGEASDFLAEMPQQLRGKYPEVALLEKLAGKEAVEGEGGKVVSEAVPPTDLTFKELRQLRSWLRSGIDYADLTPSMREGSVKKFAGRVNEMLHDVSLDPRLGEASRLLDTADNFYRENVPYLNDSMVTTIMKGLREGVPPDPHVLADVLFDANRSEALSRARDIVGPTLWKYVQAAHTQKVISKNLNLLGEVEAKGFARSVESMYQDGTLEKGYSKEFADRLNKAARNVQQLEGNLTLKVGGDETLQSLIDRSEMMAAQVKQMADADPLKALSEGVKRVDKDFNAQMKAMRESRRQEPMHFLYEKSMTALPIRAANRILADQDLIVAAANRFGLKSPEMNALREVYVQRLFQRPLGKVGHLREEIGGAGEREGRRGISEEVQAIMFPGVTRDTMLELVKNAEFLFSASKGDIGGSLAGMSMVMHPMTRIPLGMSEPMKLISKVPGVSSVGRFVLGKFFRTVMDGVSHPNFINWLSGELRKGGAERAMARDVLQSRFNTGMNVGGAIGAFQDPGSGTMQ